MTSEPQIEILSSSKRKRFFLGLCVLFALLLPTMIFYTSGYRINLDDTENRIVTTGGLYITTDNLDVDVYLDDEQVRRPRLFRSAYYIQDVESGMHRVIVQQTGLHTWVKELPVDPYIVIEAAAFNMPLQPQLRYIPEYSSPTGESVVPTRASSSPIFSVGTTSQTLLFATSTATSTYELNPEHEFVESLFSTTTATTTSLVARFLAEVERFGFATTTTATTTDVFVPPSKGNIQLVEREGELFARWVGSDSAIPYYYCVANTPTTTIAERYGEHVAEQVSEQTVSTTTPLYVDENRVCRREIRIDRKRQDVIFYEFLPGASDLVLLQLEDGLYVSEIDDRAWQNTQQIFPGNGFSVLVENDVIYLKLGELYAELLKEPLQP
jgi:hypothetical protein